MAAPVVSAVLLLAIAGALQAQAPGTPRIPGQNPNGLRVFPVLRRQFDARRKARRQMNDVRGAEAAQLAEGEIMAGRKPVTNRASGVVDERQQA